MNRKRRSIMWTLEKEKLQEIVSRSNSLADIMRHFNFVRSNGNYNTLKNRLNADNIDYSHIKLGGGSNKGKRFPNNRAAPLEEVMIENSTYCRGTLKKRLLENGMLKNECSICGLKGEWNGKPLTMILDHVNGKNSDHRYINLRMVCCNCNSQLETTNWRRKRTIVNCLACGCVISKDSLYCKSCCTTNHPDQISKIESSKRFTIEKEELEKLIWEKPTSEIAKMFNVSDVAIAKRCTKFGIQKPPRGYWTQFKEPKLENLKKFDPAELIDLTCFCCEKTFQKKKSKIDYKIKNGQENFYCSKECMFKIIGKVAGIARVKLRRK